MNRILIYHHLGLGDHIICNGLVRYIHGRYKLKYPACDIDLVVKNNNFQSVSYMFSDLDLKYLRVNHDKDVNAHSDSYDKVITFGGEWMEYWTKTANKLHRWEEAFYRQVGFPYSIRWSKFKVDRNIDEENTLLDKLALPEKFAFVCASSSGGDFPLPIDTSLPVVRLEPLTDCMFHWIPVVNAADEIHTIDTSMYHLIEQICPVASKVFYDVRRFDPGRALPPRNDVTWKIVEV